MQKELETISTQDGTTEESITPVTPTTPTIPTSDAKLEISLDSITVKDESTGELKLNENDSTTTDSAPSSPSISRSTSSEPLMMITPQKTGDSDTRSSIENKTRTFSEAAGEYNPDWKSWSKQSRISNVYKIFLYTLIYIFNGLSGNSLAFGLTTFQKETKANDEATGWWWTALSLGFMIGTIVAGWLFDHFKERGPKQPFYKTWFKITGHKICMLGVLLQIACKYKPRITFIIIISN
jgi:hypothetical protein